MSRRKGFPAVKQGNDIAVAFMQKDVAAPVPMVLKQSGAAVHAQTRTYSPLMALPAAKKPVP